MTMSTLTFFVNGRKIEDKEPDLLGSLLTYLRRKLLLTGTKLVCGQGGCGACTILISRYDHSSKTLRHFSANACLLPLAWVHGCAITTIEGLGSTKTQLHPLQKSLADHHGSQCGMCSPGMVMAVKSLVCNSPRPPTVTDIEDTLSGNLCRCTGYRPIYEAFESFLEENDDKAKLAGVGALLPDISAEDMREISTKSVILVDGETTWHHATELSELLRIRTEYPKAPLALGYTTLFWSNQGKSKPPVIISGTAVPVLSDIEIKQAELVVGAAVTINRLVRFIEELDQANTGNHQYSGLVEMAKMLKTGFGSDQLRNIATVGGSIASGSGSSDIITTFVALGGTINLHSQTEKRAVIMDERFLASGKDLVKDGEVIVSIEVPVTKKNEAVRMYKHVLRRGAKSLLTVAAKFVISEETGSRTITNTTIAIGGFSRTVQLLPQTGEFIKITGLKSDVNMNELNLAVERDLPCGSKNVAEHKYKIDVSVNFIRKIVLEFAGEKEGCVSSDRLKSKQKFMDVPDLQSESDHVGRPLIHQAAYQQCTGEALYLDDIPERRDELFMVFVKSSKAHAYVKSIDASEALSLPGVVDFISASNVPSTMSDFFASDKVEYHGHVLGVVLADSRDRARQAATNVKIQYEKLEPVLDVDKAIEQKAFHGERTYSRGDVTRALQDSDKIISGTSCLGSQEHWYLETLCCLAVPGENQEMEITLTTQAQTLVQQAVCKAVGLPANKVVMRTKRLGGAFGGKDASRGSLVAIPSAFAAQKHGRPVRCVLEREEDICLTGQRVPFTGRYKIGMQNDGRINALDMEIFVDGGWRVDCSMMVIEKAITNMDSCYKIPTVSVVGRSCKTNKSSRPPFRGFGSPDVHFLLETALDQCARELNIEPSQLRRKNLLSVGDVTVMNMKLDDCTAIKCWEEVLDQSSYKAKKESISDFNSRHLNRKRGLYAVPVKMSGSFGTNNPFSASLSRASAMVNAYQDGTVLVAHNGIEMGQGLNTKMIQIASRVLDIPPSQIHIAETRTDILANGVMSAASAATDNNGPAVQDACEKLMALLKSYINANPKGKWIDWVNAAVADRVSLTAVGYFKREGMTVFNWEKGTGDIFPYFTYGAGVTEVEIDCLTGKYQIIKTDIVMDVGRSLNPAIDVGQIEGAFVQMTGLLTTERIEHNEEGVIMSTSIGSYILPGIENIPRTFNVSLLRDSPNPYPQAIYSSKAIGEPPMTLAVSVFFAIREAIAARRQEAGLPGEFTLDAPATADRVLAACTIE